MPPGPASNRPGCAPRTPASSWSRRSRTPASNPLDAARSVLLPAPDAAVLEAAIRAGQDEAARVEELFAGEELTLAARELEADGPLDAAELEQLRAEAAAR